MPQTMLLNSLDALRRKVKVLGVAYGIGIALAVAVVGLLCAAVLDYLLNLPAAPRIFVSLVVLGAIAHVLWWYLINPAIKRISLSDMAGKLETAFPQFDDRLRSTVNFLGGAIPGSDAMKDRVVGETTTLASRLDLSRAVVTAPAWYSVTAGIGAVGFLFLLATYVINPTYRNIALARLFMPFADNAWPKRVQIDLVGQLPQRIPVGQRLDVRMKLGKGDRESMKAIVYYQYDDGAVMQEFMTRGAEGTYSASLDTRVESGKASTAMKVWMRAGDDERQVGAVTVVPRLMIKSVEAVISPPEYVQPQQSSTVNLSAAPAVMAVGSKVAVRITFNKPLDAGVEPEIVPLKEADKSSAAPKIVWTRDGNLSAVGSWVATNSMRFRVRGTDTDQFSNSALEEYELIVRPDQTPTVQIENPRRSEERTPIAVIPMQAVAEDDYGITSLKLVIDRLGDKRHWEIPLVESASPVSGINWNRAEATGDRLRFRVNHDWDLSKLDKADLKSGDVLEYYLLVTDNFLLNGQRHEPVPSGKLRIAIISQDDLTNRVIDELRKVKEQIGATKNNQTRTKQETENLKSDTKDKPDFDAADRAAAERLTNQQANAAAQAMALSTRLQNLQKTLDENKSPSNDLKDLARDVKSDLDRAADGPMKQAGQDLQNITQPNQPKDKRDAALDDAQNQQTKATDQLQQAMDRMANIGSLAQTIERIAEILKDQKDVTKQTADAGHDNLGKRPEEMKPEDRKKLEEAADAQAKLADRTGKAMEDMAKMAEQMKRSDPSAAEAMEKAAQTAKQQNVQKQQQQAAQNAKQNQQAPAQSAQRQAELGLEMMLNQLREAERNRLAELSKKLEELQKQVANLIRRQSGHNLDNLTVQGPDALAKIGNDVLGGLFEKSQRDPKQPPAPPAVPQLSQSQEQTERNTRDIAKSAEGMPNGSEPASHLVRAAGKMERANFSLRDSKLPEAYDPSQVEALVALEQAKKLVDEQKNKVDEQIADSDREAVRAKYVKIKEDQEKLNADTTRIDQSKDPANGQVPRAEAIRLGQLPGDQGKLADRVSAIDKDLAEVGSIVYVWANKDINAAMNGVKTDLGKPDTGAPIQDQQKRIVAQLDAMIRNLAIKPKESKFAQDAGGGGQGQQGGPKLPTEAELRLLKDLQSVVNDDTTAIDAKPDKQAEKPKLQALGNRQGDLRGLLDKLLQEASKGETKLGPEPDKATQLPEEAQEGDVENQELDQNLLNDKPETEGQEKQAMLVGDRMARSRQRLALNNDPGKVTQMIQKRIVIDLDNLIEQARQQQAQTRNQKPNNNPGEKMPAPGENGKQPANSKPQTAQNKTNASNPAADSIPGVGSQKPETDVTKDIRESAAEWGGLTPRQREAILQGGDDQVLDEYRKLVDDYWRALSTKAKDR